jgi:hypothetical protein
MIAQNAGQVRAEWKPLPGILRRRAGFGQDPHRDDAVDMLEDGMAIGRDDLGVDVRAQAIGGDFAHVRPPTSPRWRVS